MHVNNVFLVNNVAKPKIKITAIHEINTLVAFVLRSKVHFSTKSQNPLFFRVLVLWVIGSQNTCAQRVYLDDADDFYFWTCKKYLLEKSYSGFMIKIELYLTHDYRLFLCKIQWKCIQVPCIPVIIYIGKISRYGSNIAKNVS